MTFELKMCVRFDTVAYGSRYGALEPSRGFGCTDPSHNHEEDLAAVDRDTNEKGANSEKKNFRDFALWKPVADPAEAGKLPQKKLSL
jgi:cysteinyl-tRNA synthetase